MADEPQTDAQEEPAAPKGGGLVGKLVWMTAGVVLAAGGFSLPYFCPGLFGIQAEEKAPEPPKPAFIPMDALTVHIGGTRSNRFLRVTITMQVDESDLLMVTELMEKRKAIIRNWLIIYLSNQDLDEIHGVAGKNRLRREIQGQLNTVLFDDSIDRVHDILFEEFMLQ